MSDTNDNMTLYERLFSYTRSMLPFHMPGHKRNCALSEDGYLQGLGAALDITEVDGFDNLAAPEGILLELSLRTAKLFHSEHTKLLVNGSTGGILAAIYATVSVGGEVIVARNCHTSVYHALSLVNARVHYLFPCLDEQTGIVGPITAAMVKEALAACDHPELVILTSPTYEGIVSEVSDICALAHAEGVPVLVDSAHGAHFSFGGFHKSAVEQGADLVVMSLHKTLPSLTQTALLHQNGTLVSYERLSHAVNVFQTSSPSYLMLASIDGCVHLLEKQGENLFADWEYALDCFYEEMKNLQVFSLLDPTAFSHTEPFLLDRSKLVILTVKAGITGSTLSDILRREYHIETEMSAGQYVIAMTGLLDTRESLHALAAALLELDVRYRQGSGHTEPYEMSWTKSVNTSSTAMSFFEVRKAETETLRLTDAIGEIAAELVFAYPPGVPVIVWGERVTAEAVSILEKAHLQGVHTVRSSGRRDAGLLVVKSMNSVQI